MGTLNLRFTKEEIDALIAKYSIGNGLVCYSKLCDNIDHVFSDTWSGACDTELLDPTTPHPVYDLPYFDHRPVVCELRGRPASPTP